MILARTCYYYMNPPTLPPIPRFNRKQYLHGQYSVTDGERSITISGPVGPRDTPVAQVIVFLDAINIRLLHLFYTTILDAITEEHHNSNEPYYCSAIMRAYLRTDILPKKIETLLEDFWESTRTPTHRWKMASCYAKLHSVSCINKRQKNLLLKIFTNLRYIHLLSD